MPNATEVEGLREAAHFDAHVGGNRNNGGNAGLWYLNVNNSATNTNTNIGSRLARVP